MNMIQGVRAAFCLGAIILYVGDVAAQTGQERAEAAGRSLVGRPAPALVVQTIDGHSVDLGSLYGKQAVYLKFWATWCGPCRAQMPHFKHVYEMAGTDLAVIGVDVGFNDSLPDVRKAIDEFDLKMPTVMDDGRLAAAFNLRVTPQHVVIGRDGLITYIGQVADEKLDAALRAAQSTAATRSATRVGTAKPATIVRYRVGDTLPDVSATAFDGTPIRLRDASHEKPTALVFMSPWCESYYSKPVAEKSIPGRPALATSCREVREQVTSLAKLSSGVRWLGVASGLWSTPNELREYEATYALGIPLMMDESGEWFRAFDVMRVPTVVIADAHGKIVWRAEGYDETFEREIRRVK
jgi:peroxiredoxin